jgi:antitoxin VapB
VVARTKVFKSGNANAVRFPASFAVEPGMVVEVREEQSRWIIEKVPEEPQKIDVWSFYGSIPDLKALKPEDRLIEDRPSARRSRDSDGG